MLFTPPLCLSKINTPSPGVSPASLLVSTFLPWSSYYAFIYSTHLTSSVVVPVPIVPVNSQEKKVSVGLKLISVALNKFLNLSHKYKEVIIIHYIAVITKSNDRTF